MTTSIETSVRANTQPTKSMMLCFFTQLQATISTEKAIHIFSMEDQVPVLMKAAMAFRFPRNQSPPAIV